MQEVEKLARAIGGLVFGAGMFTGSLPALVFSYSRT